MTYQAIIKFYQEGDEYLAIQSSDTEYAHDMVISSIYSLLALLHFGDNKFDSDVIDHMKMRVEELRNK